MAIDYIVLVVGYKQVADIAQPVNPTNQESRLTCCEG